MDLRLGGKTALPTGSTVGIVSPVLPGRACPNGPVSSLPSVAGGPDPVATIA